MYQKVEQKKRSGKHDNDDKIYKAKKSEVNRELIKLQQKMKQICTTKKERYVELKFDEFTKIVVVEGVETLFKLNMLGAESPVKFTADILDNDQADLKMYLSTKHSEPNEKKCQRFVERMRVFKLNAEDKKQFFEMDDICYIMMYSKLGCTLQVKAESKLLRATLEPEKQKVFNEALTEAEKNAQILEEKKHQQHVLRLEEKYQQMLEDYNNANRPSIEPKNMKLENK